MPKMKPPVIKPEEKDLPPLTIPEILEACLSSPAAESERSSDTVTVVDGLFAIAHALGALAVQVQALNETAGRIERQQKFGKVLLS